jgi:hypothetical protein
MKKQRGWPDRRGMGSESDSISEQFVPNEYYKSQQVERAKILAAAGFTPEQIAAVFPVPIEPPPDQKPKDQ